VKSEWAVTPIIVVCTFVVGSLQSVALGLALSTFIFVGTLNKHGVVKFIATGLTVHSITERSAEDAAWLDQNGDLIQLLVLQSYIFFGNAYSCLSYVNSMFEELPEHITKKLSFPLPPFPQYIIIDMTLVSGVDTSSVDIFGEIIQLCFRHKCQVYLSGLNNNLKNVLCLGGLKPSIDKKSPNSMLRFVPELETALSQAEDGLLKSMSYLEEKELRRIKIRANSSADDGFLYALKEIDKQVRSV
jgi:MFS superfamily sulfate permease-like transporter